VWRYLKHVELGNVCCDDLPELRGELRLAIKRLRQKPRVPQGCLGQCDARPGEKRAADTDPDHDSRAGQPAWPTAA
jgi:hypothetical protein